MKIHIETLKEKIQGKKLNANQEAEALNEFNILLAYVRELEELTKYNNLSTDEILEHNEKRPLSNTTKINCSKCGTDFKINNRHILPFEYERLNKNIGRIWIPCPRCDQEYDLGICRYY